MGLSRGVACIACACSHGAQKEFSLAVRDLLGVFSFKKKAHQDVLGELFVKRFQNLAQASFATHSRQELRIKGFSQSHDP